MKTVYRIFLVEDNLDDVRLIQEALRLQGIEYRLTHFDKVDEAVRAVAEYGLDNSDLPSVFLLDYNVPRGDARDVLAAVAKNPVLAGVPKAILTSSVAPRDRQQAFDMGANCFINKPADLFEFLSEVGSKVAGLLDNRSAGAVSPQSR